MQDPNPLMRFFKRPFVKSMLKLAAYVFVGWHVLWFTIGLSFFALLIGLGVFFSGMEPAPMTYNKLGALEYVYGDTTSLNKLLVLPIKGEIIGDGPADTFGSLIDVTSGYEIKQKLYEAAQDPDVHGVMLAIDSPGGTIYGSRAIADGVQYYQEKTKQPVFAHIEGLGASGAYMGALPAKQIIADYGTDIGSIGVIMGPFKYYNGVISESGSLFESGVLTQNGIEAVTITAGKSKDIGNPYRRLTGEERNQLQQSINNEYDQFVQLVTDHRGIDNATVRNQIGAMIYDPKTAQQLKLIDGVDSREKTYARLAKEANVSDYQVVQEVQSFGFIESLLGVVGKTPKKEAKPYDKCLLTQVKLAYHGNVTELCKQ